jgi:hypothetical protein
MSTSGTTNFNVDRNQIISGALRLCGVLAEGETATTEQINNGAEALNMLVKRLMADGMPLWAMKQYSVTLVAGQKEYTIGVGEAVNTAKPLRVVQAFNHATSGSLDIPMRIVTRDEYNKLGNKTSSGNPIQIFYEPLNETGKLHVFPVPDSTSASQNVVTLVYQRPFEDFDSSTDTPDFPQEWLETIKYLLATRLAGEYQTPLSVRQQLLVEATALKEASLSMGTEEGSFYFGVDVRT